MSPIPTAAAHDLGEGPSEGHQSDDHQHREEHEVSSRAEQRASHGGSAAVSEEGRKNTQGRVM